MALKVFRFFNIGKANAEIERLETELASANSAKPEDNSAKLQEAVESNETISAELTQSRADLATVRATVETLSAEAKVINETIGAALNALKLEPKADATSAEKITMLADSVSATLAKLAVSPAVIPGSKADAGVQSNVITQLESEKDPVKRAKLFKANFKSIAAIALAK
jgi:small-conductance mechanosensitive channel